MARLAVLGAVVAVLAGCGEPSETRVVSDDARFILHLPTSYTVFEADVSASAAIGASPTLGEYLNAQGQISAFDASPDASTQNITDILVDYPTGWVISIPILSDQLKDELSWASMRNLQFGVDSVPGAQPILTEPINFPDLDLMGYRVVAELPATSDTTGPWVTIDSTVLTDDQHERLWMLYVGCSYDCYQKYDDEIQAIVDSWVVKKP